MYVNQKLGPDTINDLKLQVNSKIPPFSKRPQIIQFVGPPQPAFKSLVPVGRCGTKSRHTSAVSAEREATVAGQ